MGLSVNVVIAWGVALPGDYNDGELQLSSAFEVLSYGHSEHPSYALVLSSSIQYGRPYAAKHLSNGKRLADLNNAYERKHQAVLSTLHDNLIGGPLVFGAWLVLPQLDVLYEA